MLLGIRHAATPLQRLVAICLGCLACLAALSCEWLVPTPKELELADPKATVLDPDSPLDVCFSADVAGGAGKLSYEWNYGDGTTCNAACQPPAPLARGSCEPGASPPAEKLHRYPDKPKTTYSPFATVTDGDLQVEVLRFPAVLVGNRRPRAAFKDPSRVGFVRVRYSIDGSASRDDDGSINEWRYNWGDPVDPRPTVLQTPVPATHVYSAAGPYRIELTVTDDNGVRSAAAPWDVEMVNDTTPPTLSITHPAEGDAVPDDLTIVAQARDDVEVVQVTFTVDDRERIGTVPGPGPVFQAPWDTRRLEEGQHWLKAVAFDEAGNRSEPAIVHVVIRRR